MEYLGRILIVEDSENDVELTLAALESSNLANEVVVVNDGEQALNYLFRRGDYKDRAPGLPAVILLDVKMPKLNGIEVLREIKKDSEMKNVPVVMLTSSKEEPDVAECYRLGANAYVVKPVDFEQFKECVVKLGMFWAVINEPPPGIERGV